jgi:hypothetical protein
MVGRCRDREVTHADLPAGPNYVARVRQAHRPRQQSGYRGKAPEKSRARHCIHFAAVDLHPAADAFERCGAMSERTDDLVSLVDGDHLARRAFDMVEPRRLTHDFALDEVTGIPVAPRKSLHLERVRIEVRDPGERSE